MIFAFTWEAVLNGSKWQTRRLVTDNQVDDKTLAYDAIEWPDLRGRVQLPKSIGAVFTGVERGDLRIQWQVGRDYAVQPGRGKKQVGRIRLTGIRQEHVQDITEEDAAAELGELNIDMDWYNDFCWQDHPDIRDEWKCYIFKWLWKHIHTTPGTRWEDNPLVWVLEFELVKEPYYD